MAVDLHISTRMGGPGEIVEIYEAKSLPRQRFIFLKFGLPVIRDRPRATLPGGAGRYAGDLVAWRR